MKIRMELLQELLDAYGPSGREDAVREAISRSLSGHVDSLSVDAMGNLIAVRRGSAEGKRVMICAHMDQIGLAVTDADKHGFLRVAEVGGIDAGNLVGAHVAFSSGVEGVVYCEPLEGRAGVKVSNLFVDIGADSREEALSRVPIGEVCVTKPHLSRLGEHRIASPALDDRIACYVLIEAMRALPERLPGEVVAVFTVQEEVGVRGATTAAYAVDPDIGIAVDVTVTGDTPEDREKMPMRLGEGAAIKIMDMGVISSPQVVRLMEERAKAHNLRVQREVMTFGGTDAGAIAMTRRGVPSGAISIPCRYVHSPAETVDLRDVEAAVDLLVSCVCE